MSADPISVVMPHYGCEDYLLEAVRSVLNQSYPPAELIVVDDCSPTPVWLEALQATLDDKRLRVFRTTSRVGPYRILNAVLPMIASPLIAFQDADDVSHHERFRRQLNMLKDAEIVGCRFRTIDEAGMPIPWWRTRRLWKFRYDIWRNRLAHLPSCLMRCATVRGLGGFDGSTMFGADTDFMWRAARANRILNTTEILYDYRQRPGSLTLSCETGIKSAARLRYRRELKSRMRVLRESRNTSPRVIRAIANDVNVELISVSTVANALPQRTLPPPQASPQLAHTSELLL